MSIEWETKEDEYGAYKQRENALGIVETLVVSRTQKWHDENPPGQPIPQPPTLEEQLAEKDSQILKLKEEQFKTHQMTIQNGTTQQELIELLMDMGVI